MNPRLQQWVDECIALTQPDSVHWCDGSDAEYEKLIALALAEGVLTPLNQKSYPGCYLHRSDPNDVARVEQLTFICSKDEEDAGPTNNWHDPAEMKARMTDLYRGCMRGRTMYIIPYLMGPAGSPFSKVGVEITDSLYVVINMRTMTRMGTIALDRLADGGEFVPGLHSVGELDPERRYICHFPEERLIWSYGSGYGGNALLGKKCFSLRIASTMARDEGWLAEHMLILELQEPDGAKSYWAAAFPSACGKTNFAMMISTLEHAGYKVRTIGDDIAWLHPGEDGRLWAINPEAGFFGVVPGTNMNSNPNALLTARSNSIYTNVAVSDDGIPWWEGKGEPAPDVLTDWKGRRPWTGEAPAAHPNSRFTAPARQCPCISPDFEAPQGVPISGIIFGGRRSTKVPLVAESFDWAHGVFLGATAASETTAAAAGKTGVLRRDPMAMLPFCGYNMGDYFAHWLKVGAALKDPPRIFYVNWFRKDAEGSFMWPGFGENIRALIWMAERVRGSRNAKETPIGLVPTPGDLHLEGLDIPCETVEELLRVRPKEWFDEIPNIEEHFARFGEHLPAALNQQVEAMRDRLGRAV